MENIFKLATRENIKLKIGFSGPSGSGKTYSALLLARGIVGKEGKIALVDTEHTSSLLYSHLTNFDAAMMNPPYLVSKYVKSIENAVENKYDILIFDTISAEWNGEGGLLEQKQELDERGGNQFANWKNLTVDHQKFLAAILNAPIHLICCMRSKQDYILSNENGKMKPIKVGLAPVQREGIEYEFSMVFDVDMQHRAQISKARTHLFDGKLFTVTEEAGKALINWANGKDKEI